MTPKIIFVINYEFLDIKDIKIAIFDDNELILYIRKNRIFNDSLQQISKLKYDLYNYIIVRKVYNLLNKIEIYKEYGNCTTEELLNTLISIN